LDRARPHKGRNAEWQHPHDPDARITKMKDGRTHLAHKAEHAVDVETTAIVAVTVHPATAGDTETLPETITAAAAEIDTVCPDTDGPREAVADKGYHSNRVLVDLEALGLRTYISEPARGRRSWREHPEARAAVYRNRRRIRGARGRRLLRQRGERLERPCAHLYRTGRMRRTHVRGHANVLKRLWLHAGAANLGLLMRTAFGVGTPRSLQGHAAAFTALLWTLWDVLVPPIRTLDQLVHSVSPRLVLEGHAFTGALVLLPVTPFTTDC
jgi:transposase